MAYDAFVSYSHAADGLLAPRLQGGLQKFAKPWWRRRALRVFRDETGLSVNPHLWNSITDALDESKWFVLLASEEAARSPWIEREISYWREHKDPARILPVVTGGEWVWDETATDFDWEASTAVPAALAGVFVSEPRHLDLRWAGAEEQLDLRNSRFRGDVAQIAAAIRGVPKDDLEGEDVRQHRRTLRWAWGAAVALVVLTVLSGGTAVAAVRNADEAQRNEAAAISAQAQADANASEAAANANEAQANADEAEHQKSNAEQNATLAARSQTEAEAQQARAEANATKAQNNADQAAANADEAQRNADQAAANATDAQRNADEAAANAAEAQDNADRANAATAEANDQRAQAVANAADAANKAAELAVTNEDLADTNDNLKRQTRIALSRQVAATALNNVDFRYDRALLQAVAANGIVSTAQARDSLLRTVLARPEMRVQFRPTHGSDIGVLVSPNGDTIGTANIDGGGEIWDARTGKLRFELPVDDATIYDAAFGPDDEVAVVTDSELVVVNTTTGGVRLRIPYPSAPLQRSMAFARDGESLAMVRPTATGYAIDRWDVSGPASLVETIPEVASQPSIPTFSPDGALLAWAELDFVSGMNRLYIRRLADGRQIGPLALGGVFPEFSQTFSALVFSADGQTLESVLPAGDDAIVFWDADTGERRTTRAVSSGVVVAASPDQQLIAISTPDGTVAFEDASTGASVGKPTEVDPAPFSSYVYAFTPDGTALVVVVPDGGVQIIDVVPHARSFGRRNPVTMTQDDYPLALSPDGTLIAIQHDTDPGGLSVVDVASGEVVREVASPVYSARFSPNGEVLAFNGEGGALMLLDVRQGTVRQLHDGQDQDHFFGSWALSPDGKTVAEILVSLDSTPATLRFWDVATATPSARPSPVLRGIPSEVAFSPDGTLAVTTFDELSSQGQIELFPPSGPPRTLPGHSGLLQFSPDGKVLAIFDSDAVLLSMPDGIPIGAPLTPLRGDSYITSLAFDLDDNLVVTGHSDGTIQLWDLLSTTPIGPALAGHTRVVGALVFAPSGRLVSVHGGAPSVSDGEVMTWALDTSSLLREACTRANRELTPTEWTELVGDALPYNPPCAPFRDT